MTTLQDPGTRDAVRARRSELSKGISEPTPAEREAKDRLSESFETLDGSLTGYLLHFTGASIEDLRRIGAA